jgi:hypothetical protein
MVRMLFRHCTALEIAIHHEIHNCETPSASDITRQGQEARSLAGVRITALQSRPMAFLDVTSVMLDEFQQRVPPFETAFHARMAAWCLDG